MGDGKLLRSRRDFVALSAAFMAGAFMPRVASATASGPGPRAISVVGLIDVTQALADGSLKNNAYWFDNNARGGSSGLGTENLVSVVERGAAIQWHVWSLEVETISEITGISGPGATVSSPSKVSIENGAFIFWQGKIDVAAVGRRGYDIAVNVGGVEMTIPSALSLDVR